MGFEVRSEIPGLDPEAKRALVEVQTSLKRELDRMEQRGARPKRRVTELAEEGAVIARPGEVVRVQPSDTDITVYLPEPGPANGGEDVIVSFEGDGTATGKVLVVPINGTCASPGTQTLNSPGQYRYTSTGARGAKPGLDGTAAGAAAGSPSSPTWSGPPPIVIADLPEEVVVRDTLPGAPVYDAVVDFGAVGDGIADDTAALNAAIVAANATPGRIMLGARHRITAALTTVTGNNIIIQGRGDFNGGSRIIGDSVAAIDGLTFTGQYQGVRDVWFVGLKAFTSGWALRIRNAFRFRAARCVISQWCFGVEVFRSVLTYLDKVNTDDTYGVFAFWSGGDSGGENHAVTFRSCTAGVSMPGSIVGAAKAWTAGEAVVVGNVRVANSAIWQCVQSGTTAGAGSGPSGLPSTSPSTVHTTQVTDNGAKWVFAMPAFVGFLQDSYCHTFEMIDCGTLQGLYGFSMEDSANTGTSYPQFARARNLQCDHPLSRGVRLAAGGAARFGATFVTSVYGGSGIEIGSGFGGNWEFVGGEVFGCSEAGVLMNKGDGVLDALQIGACGSVSSGTRDAIEVANSAARWSITGCSGGQMFTSTTPATRYGLSIAAGCDHYAVVGNRFEGNVTGGILNTPGRSSTRVVLNNIPDLTITKGSSWGLQIDATSPAVPVEITGAEQGENYRVDTRQTVSVSGTQDIALNDDTTVLVLQLTADTTLRSLRTQATGDGRLVRIEHDSGAFTLTIAHNGATPTYSPFFNPNLADMQVTRGAIVVARSRTGFWRPEYPGSRMRTRKNSTGTVFDRGRFNLIEGTGVTLTVADDGTNDEVDITVASSVTGLTDGDKGDVTVSASGATWTVDNDVVTDAKLRNSAALSVIGRSANSTGDPADIAAGTDGHVLRRTGTTLAFGTVATAGIADAAVTDAKIGDRQPLSLFGRSANSSGQGADIDAISGSGSVMRESGGAINWGQIATAGITDAAVTLAKQANLAQSTIVGRAESAGTGVPTALTPTQVTNIIDGEALFWTGTHEFSSSIIARGAFMLATVASGTLAAQSDNFNPGQATQCRFTLTGSQNISGIVPPTTSEECVMLVVNADDTDNLTLLHNNAGSTNVNRFFLPGNTDRTLIPRASALLHYDVTDGRWHMVYAV